jgi:hypothetical protein
MTNPIAIHEAAHALAAMRFGGKVAFIELTQDGRRGAMELVEGMRPPVARIFMALAGKLAECRVTGDEPEYSEHDYREAREAAAILGARTNTLPGRVIHRIEHDINAWLALPDIWGHLERIAAKLVERGRLTGEQIAVLVEGGV